MLRKIKDTATLIPFLAIVALFELVPLFTIIFGSFKADDGSGITFDNYVRVFSKPAYQTAIVNSLVITMFSVVAGIIIAVVASAAVRNCGRKVQNIFSSILNITSNFAGVPLAFAYMIMLGNSGVLVLIGEKFGISALANFDLYSTSGLAFMYVYFQIPLGTLLMLPAFDAIKKQWKEAAVLMKAGPAKFWDTYRDTCTYAKHFRNNQCIVFKCAGGICNSICIAIKQLFAAANKHYKYVCGRCCDA